MRTVVAPKAGNLRKKQPKQPDQSDKSKLKSDKASFSPVTLVKKGNRKKYTDGAQKQPTHPSTGEQKNVWYIHTMEYH